MGTSWNRKWYKMFSFDTSVRNPRRNKQFLQVLVDLNLDWQFLTEEKKRIIYCELIRRWVYHVTNIPASVKAKYLKWELLTSEEIEECRKLNPQMTKDEWRARTHIVALRYTWLINFLWSARRPKIEITPLWRNLLNNDVSVEDIYSKSMIWLHYSSPQRTSVNNKSRPFLNTLFVIREINKKYENEKWIRKDEFAIFVLTMKNCDYMSAVNEIIKYRNYLDELTRRKVGKTVIENKSFEYFNAYMKANWILPLSKTTVRDYYDDVYRKFEMTWLLVRSGMKSSTYVRYNKFNIEKVNSLLDYYKDYKYETFLWKNDEEKTAIYTKYLTNIHLPWATSDEIKQKIIDDKIRYIEKIVVESEDKLALDEVKNGELTLDEKLLKLDTLHYRDLFAKKVEDIPLEEMIRELLIISRNKDNKESNYEGIDEWLRLEWFTALITAKIYWSKYVEPNLTLDEDWIPKSWAPWWKPDINFITETLYCLLEVTTIRNSKQQENSETTSISSHLRNLKTEKNKCSCMIAPLVHPYIADYFQTRSKIDWTKMLALTIESYIKIILDNPTSKDFENITDQIKENLSSMVPEEYCEDVNSYRFWK